MKTTIILALGVLTSSMAMASTPKKIEVTGHYFGGASYGMYLGRMEMDLVNTAKDFCAKQGETLTEITEVKVRMNATFNEFTNSRLDNAGPMGKSFTSGVVTCSK